MIYLIILVIFLMISWHNDIIFPVHSFINPQHACAAGLGYYANFLAGNKADGEQYQRLQ